MADKMFLRISEVAEALCVSRATAYDLVARGSIPSVRFKGRGGRAILRVPARALLEIAQRSDSGMKPVRDAR